MKAVKYIIPFLLFLIAFYLFKDVNKDSIKEKIRSEYKGVIIDSLYNHGAVYIVQTNDKTYKLSLMNSKFLINARVGDSIVKFRNRNECLLFNKNKKIRVPYVYNPKGYTTSK